MLLRAILYNFPSCFYASFCHFAPTVTKLPSALTSMGLKTIFSESLFSETLTNVRLFPNLPRILERLSAGNLCNLPLKEAGARITLAWTDPNVIGDVFKRNISNCSEFILNTQPGWFRHWLHAEHKWRGWCQMTRDWPLIMNSLRKLLITCTCGGIKSKIYHINYFEFKKRKEKKK